MAFEGISIEALLIVAVLCAVVAFFYSNLGLGGGQLYVPIMALTFTSLEMREIVPLSLTFAFVTMLSSTLTHSRKKLVDFRLGLMLALGGLLGVAGGALFTLNVDEDIVKVLFATLLVIVATKMLSDIYRKKQEYTSSPTEFTSKRKMAGVAMSILTGLLIGSFGIGGGVVSVPLIIYVFKTEARRAIGTSALMGAILTPAAFLAYVLSANGDITIHYDVAALLAPLIMVMAIIGSTWGLQKLRTRVVKTIFTGGVYLAACGMIYSLLFQ